MARLAVFAAAMFACSAATAPMDGGDSAADARPVGTCDTMPAPNVASRQTVRFHFARAAGYVVRDGNGCGAFSVTRLGAMQSEVALGIRFECVCECANPGSPRWQSALSLDVDGGATLTWDARAITTCTRYVDCAARGWPGAGYQAVTETGMQPVAPGRYRVTFGIESTLPTGCFPQADGTVNCGFGRTPGPWMGWSDYSRCPTEATRAVEFDLPATGDVDVNVPPM